MIKQIEFSKRTEKWAEAGGYLGMLLIHAATLPTSIMVILGYATTLPPLNMVLLVWAGLIFFLIRAIVRFDWLYIISNAVGFIANSVLLAIIFYGG